MPMVSENTDKYCNAIISHVAHIDFSKQNDRNFFYDKGPHKIYTLSFLKQKFRLTFVSTLDELAEVVTKST